MLWAAGLLHKAQVGTQRDVGQAEAWLRGAQTLSLTLAPS